MAKITIELDYYEIWALICTTMKDAGTDPGKMSHADMERTLTRPTYLHGKLVTAWNNR